MIISIDRLPFIYDAFLGENHPTLATLYKQLAPRRHSWVGGCSCSDGYNTLGTRPPKQLTVDKKYVFTATKEHLYFLIAPLFFLFVVTCCSLRLY